MKRILTRLLLVASAAAAAQAAVWTDRSEYDLVLTVRSEATAQKQIALLDQWKAKYPQSELRQVRRELYLAAYQSMGDSAHMLETAREMLSEQPDNMVGAYWCTVLVPGAKPSPELWSAGEKAARKLLAGAGQSAPEWQKEKKSAALLAHRTLGWIQWQRGDYEAAEKEFAAYLQTEKDSAEISAWYGMTLAAQKAPEKVAPALWQLARAGALKEQGALADSQRRQVNALAERVYVSFHGDSEGLDQLRAAAAPSAFPPADFRIASFAEITARKAEEELKRTNPQLALWLNIRKQLEAPDGEKYFTETLHPAPLPKLKATVIRGTPADKPTEVFLGLSNGVTEEVVLKVASPLPFPAEPGTEIEFEGTAEAFSRTPFQLQVLSDKSKIDGWPARKR